MLEQLVMDMAVKVMVQGSILGNEKRKVFFQVKCHSNVDKAYLSVTLKIS